MITVVDEGYSVEAYRTEKKFWEKYSKHIPSDYLPSIDGENPCSIEEAKKFLKQKYKHIYLCSHEDMEIVGEWVLRVEKHDLS